MACGKGQPIRQKKSVPVKNQKNSLITPYDITWPQLNKDDVSLIKNEISRTFALLDLKRAKFKQHEKGKSVQRARYTEDQRKHWSLLKCGLRETTKALENDQLCLCLVDRNVKPDLMTKHLISLSIVRRCPAAAFHGLGQFMKRYLGFSPVTVGFKKTDEGEPTTFDSLISFIVNKVPKIDIPWLNTEEPDDSPDTDNDMSGTKDKSETVELNPEIEDDKLKKEDYVAEIMSDDIEIPSKETGGIAENNSFSKDNVKFDPYKLYITKAESAVKPKTNIFSSLSFISLSSNGTESGVKRTKSNAKWGVDVLGEDEAIHKKLKLSHPSRVKQSDSDKLSTYSTANLKQVKPRPDKVKNKSKKKMKKNKQ